VGSAVSDDPSPPERATGPSPDADVRQLRDLSHLLDEAVRVPGTRFRVGVDPIVGLLPVVGDAAGAALSAYVLGVALRSGVPRATLARIALVLWVDAAVGSVPVVGDLFDAYWKATSRSVRLLDARLADPSSAVDDRRYLRRVGIGVALLGVAALVAGAFVVRWAVAAVGL
jgi:hypothetical protein